MVAFLNLRLSLLNIQAVKLYLKRAPMTAIDILKQSFIFYTRLFNKIFWLSVASSVIPLFHTAVFSGDQVSVLGTLMIVGVSWFFSVYMMALIHQFSTEQDESLKSALSLTGKKLAPIIMTNLAFGFLVILVMIPAILIGGILTSGLNDEVLKNSIMTVLVAAPVILAVYHGFLASYFTLVNDLNPVEAIKASYNQTKNNKLYFRGILTLFWGFVLYLIVLNLLKLMIALNPFVLGMIEFTFSVFVLPLFTVFIYRLFVVTKKTDDSDEEL